MSTGKTTERRDPLGSASALELVALRGLPGVGYRYGATLSDGVGTYTVELEADELVSTVKFREAVALALGRVYRPPTDGERWLDCVLELLNEADRG